MGSVNHTRQPRIVRGLDVGSPLVADIEEVQFQAHGSLPAPLQRLRCGRIVLGEDAVEFIDEELRPLGELLATVQLDPAEVQIRLRQRKVALSPTQAPSIERKGSKNWRDPLR